MKKLAVFGVVALLLSGCATGGNGGILGDIGNSLFKEAVDYQCRNQLNANWVYKTASILMSDAQKTKIEDQVCGCVSEKAPQSVTLNEVGQAVIDPAARTQIAAKAVTRTLNACANEFLSGQ